MAIRLPFLALLLSITTPAVWAQDPAGAEFRINSYITGSQFGPAVASDVNGNFVVVWASDGQDGSQWGVFGRRFNASGIPRGSEFQVNSYTTNHQVIASVASDANGNFVVVWSSYGQDGNSWGVFGQLFNASGLPQGSEFQVNSYTTNLQGAPTVASGANGNFVVAWPSSGQDGSSDGIFGQRFNAAAVPQGSEFRVNPNTAGQQRSPSAAAAANGNFVVAWTSVGEDGSSDGVFGQRFHALGLPLGTGFRVNSYTTGTQDFPKVASDANGNFVVVWQSRQYGGYGVFGQRFNASGVPQGGEFRANTYTAGNPRNPAVGSDANGNFVVAWHNTGQDGSDSGIFGQRFSAGGLPQGPEFQVNSYTTGLQYRPAVASAANGNFVVAWESYGQDGSLLGIFGQRHGDLIFQDGFE